jgi:CRP/FNR family transcriptional regulator
MEQENTDKTNLEGDQPDTVVFVSHFLQDPLAHLPRSRILEYETGQRIYDLDQPVMGLYLVIEGRVTVRRRADNGRHVIVGIYQAHEFFGESALLRSVPAEEQAVALEDSRVMIWSPAQIENIVVHQPKLAVVLLQILVLRLLELKNRLHSLASDSAPRRLVHTLMQFSERLGQINEDGSVRIVPLTHELLAQYVGTSREAITLFMNRFRRQGYLTYSRKGNIVLRRDALAEWLRQPSAAGRSAEPCESQTVAMAG